MIHVCLLKELIDLSQAYNKGKTFKGRALKISWYRTPASTSPATPTTPTTPTVLKKVEEELGLDVDELVSNHGAGDLPYSAMRLNPVYLMLIAENKASALVSQVPLINFHH